MKLHARVSGLLAAGLLVVLAAPAFAAPTGTSVAKVFQLPCREAVCGTGDKAISTGALVRGPVQIQVTSRASLGLDTLRLEAANGGAYECWKTWSLDGATSTTQTFNWDTTQWPSPCGESDEAPGENGQVSLRAVATERASGEAHTSTAFTVRVNNRPATPVWASDPAPVGPEDGGPRVDLSWYANPEPDIVEYHWVRVDPNGDETEFAVSAEDPGGQGCDFDGSVYTCADDAFGAKGFGGRHTYMLIAYRSSPSGADSCALPPGGGCVQSAAGPDRSATLVEPRDRTDDDTRVLSTRGGTTTTTTTTRRPRGPRPVGNGTSYASLAAGKYWDNGGFSGTLPYDSRTLLSPPDDDQPPVFAAGPSDNDASAPSGRRLWTFLAGGMMALVLAAHAARLARDPH